MAAKPIAGDGIPPSLAGMSKNQLYEIMSQMKTLIEQNKQQARQILIQNPALTKALFQAQIMLGMVQPPQQEPASANPRPPIQNQPPTIQVPNQASIAIGAPSAKTSTIIPQVSNQLPQHVALQQPLQNIASQFLPPPQPLQAPLPPQQRPSMITPAQQTGPNPYVGLQHHSSQPAFHPGSKAPTIPGSYPQPPFPNQTLNQSIYQSGSPHLGRGGSSTWPPPESNASQLPAPLLFGGGHAGPSNPPARPGPLSAEMENALLQQLMSLTPEQINVLPHDQRNQILQLQQMLRQ